MLSGILWASTFLAELVYLLKGSTQEAHELEFPSLRFPHPEMTSSAFRTTLGDNDFRPDPICRRNLAVPTIPIPRKFSSDESLMAPKPCQTSRYRGCGMWSFPEDKHWQGGSLISYHHHLLSAVARYISSPRYASQRFFIQALRGIQTALQTTLQDSQRHRCAQIAHRGRVQIRKTCEPSVSLCSSPHPYRPYHPSPGLSPLRVV